MRVLDLFSGIGGFSLGLERAGMETVAFCEIDPHARAVLKKHWPRVRTYDDVCGLTADRLASDGIGPIDVITGGFPCQDVSVAGKQAGIEDGTRSGLWSEIARLVGELRPKFVIVENVSNLLAGPSERPGRWFGRVLGDLAALGYDAEWHCIPASYLGAWHQRDRVWLVAYSNEVQRESGLQVPILRQSHLSDKLSRGFEDWPGRRNLPRSVLHRKCNGVPRLMDRIERLGNSVVPQIPEMIGRVIMATQTA